MTSDLVLKDALSSDIIHNRNCYAYLLQLKPFVNSTILEFFPELNSVAALNEVYNDQFAYGNLYSFTIASLEDRIDSLYPTLTKHQSNALDDLIFSIYHNDNHILDSAEWINHISSKARPRQIETGEKIAKELVDQNAPINKTSPQKQESILTRLFSLFNPNFKPQHSTNLPSLRNYLYRKDSKIIEYRFSTQGQRHNGKVRVSPLFKRWLAINAGRTTSNKPICHIYFNNLGLDRSDLDIAGTNEKELSLALHELENNPLLKIAVITLPASKSLMSSKHYKIFFDKLNYDDVFNEFLRIAQGKKHKSGISDLRISTNTRKLIFKNKESESIVLRNLLTQSFKKIGIKPNQHLSTAQKQAVWFYFIKFALTDYIITTLEPDGYNFSCKDAIDRGAVSSVYYNLLKSFTLENPMQRKEFERALDIAAANVKGRGMNFHRKIIWNALDAYINANYNELINNPKKSWLIYWRDMNCPHSRVEHLLELRIKQCNEQFNTFTSNQLKIKEMGHELLSQIQKQYKHEVSGQRLLLEAVSRTSQLLHTSPTPKLIKSYKKLAEELRINHPALYIIGGLMECLLGVFLYIPSFGYAKPLITNGLATAKTGFFASERNLLCDELIQFSTQLR